MSRLFKTQAPSFLFCFGFFFLFFFVVVVVVVVVNNKLFSKEKDKTEFKKRQPLSRLSYTEHQGRYDKKGVSFPYSRV